MYHVLKLFSIYHLVLTGACTRMYNSKYEERCYLALKNFGLSVDDVRKRLRELQGTEHDEKEVKGVSKEEAELEFSSSTLQNY